MVKNNLINLHFQENFKETKSHVQSLGIPLF